MRPKSKFNGSKVLVVDDEEAVRNLLKEILQRAGYQVFTAADGEEALARISQQDIALALLDIKMPGISGMELLTRLKNDYPDTVAIMVTALADTHTAIETMKLGAYDYITKPFSIDEVVAKVQNAFEKRSSEIQKNQQCRALEAQVTEQAARLQEQFNMLLESLAREHRLLYDQLSSKERKQFFSRLPSELQKPMTKVEEFRTALLQLLKRTSL